MATILTYDTWSHQQSRL